ncbi:membrane protein YpdK [Pseudenterobacter timonensis]|uniref:Membrane protein YpdK n=1 Tax=Pseudenterobacter timonensis TaxID=1755099 RepID=A0ABV4ABX3_9ENTR
MRVLRRVERRNVKYFFMGISVIFLVWAGTFALMI